MGSDTHLAVGSLQLIAESINRLGPSSSLADNGEANHCVGKASSVRLTRSEYVTNISSVYVRVRQFPTTGRYACLATWLPT